MSDTPKRDPSLDDAMQYADGLPADCWADRCIIELAFAVSQYREALTEITHAGTVAWARRRAERALDGADQPRAAEKL